MTANADSGQESYACLDDSYEETFYTASGRGKHYARSHQDEHPWRDEAMLRAGYVEGEYDLRELAEIWGCNFTVIRDFLEKCEIPRRTSAETRRVKNLRKPCPISVTSKGYVAWKHTFDGEAHQLQVHQLLAIAEGSDPHRVFSKNIDVHHGPEAEIPWANWPDNLQVIEHKDHMQHHKKLSREELIEDLRAVAGVVGENPTLEDLSEYGEHGRMSYYRMFGSWTEAKKAALRYSSV